MRTLQNRIATVGARVTEAKRQARIRTVGAAVAATFVIAAAAAIPGVAQASAYGVQYWGGFTAAIGGVNVGIPAGQLAHYISGSGTWINYENVNYVTWTGSICDSSVKFSYGNGALAVYTGIHGGCSASATFSSHSNWRVPPGYACAELWVGRWQKYVARQCHYVY